VNVDEADLVENDGHYVYSVVDGRLRIIDVAQAVQVANVELPNGSSEIVLSGDRLVVVTSGYQTFGDVAPARYTIMPVNSGPTVVSVFDVSDPANPTLSGRTDLEGTSLAVRASDGVLRVVLRTGLGSQLPFVTPTAATERSEAKALAVNKQAIAESTIADWLPRSYQETADGTATDPAAALDCNKVGRPDVDDAGWGMTWVASVDLSGEPKAVGSAGVVADGSTVYASTDTLYVATPRVPAPIDGDVQKVRSDPPSTLVHAFALSGTSADYQASGEVAGWLLNQFSMSALDGTLRVATTEDTNEFGSASSSSVRILQREGDKLVESGAVTGLGKGERIFGVRFIGSLAYVVTFRQTDPLYVIDLHDVTHPALVGELKIPGYSSYLHPIDDGFLLGIGQAASDNGMAQGTKLSLFDVRDPSAPAQLATLELGNGGGSLAEYDHHAFLWYAATRQVVVPVQDFSQMGEYKASVRVVSVGADALTAQGDVSVDGGNYGMPTMRSLVVGGELVTVNQAGIQVSSLDTLETRATVTFS
jgi:hypothetical protein